MASASAPRDAKTSRVACRKVCALAYAGPPAHPPSSLCSPRACIRSGLTPWRRVACQRRHRLPVFRARPRARELESARGARAPGYRSPARASGAPAVPHLTAPHYESSETRATVECHPTNRPTNTLSRAPSSSRAPLSPLWTLANPIPSRKDVDWRGWIPMGFRRHRPRAPRLSATWPRSARTSRWSSRLRRRLLARHRLMGSLDQRVPSICLAGSFRKCLIVKFLKVCFPGRLGAH